MGAVLTILGGLGGLSGLANLEQARTTSSLYKQQAEIAQKQTANKVAQTQEQYKKLAASRQASLGASGVDVHYGSAVDSVAGIDTEGAISAQQQRYSGDLESAELRRKAAASMDNAHTSFASGILGGLKAISRSNYFKL